MEKHKWNFILQTKGNDWSQKTMQEGYMKPMLVYDTMYFKELNDAFAALAKCDLAELDSTAIHRSDYAGRHYNVMQIVDGYSNEILFDIARITIDDAVAKNIPAGIYISFVMEPELFEIETGFKMPQESFVSGTYLLPLAKYTYDTSLTLTPVSMPEPISNFIQTAGWHYKNQIEEYFHGIPPSDQHSRVFNHTYHYEGMYEAFRDFIRTKPDRLDSFLSLSNNFHEKYIHSVGIFKRDNTAILSLACVRDESFPERVYDPGIHIHFNTPIQECEKLLGIEIIPHMHYDLEERYQLIYNYTRDYETFIPTKGFENLLKQTAGKQPSVVEKQKPYVLEIEWISLKPLTVSESPKDYQKERSYGYITDAIMSLLDIENTLFDKSRAHEANAPLYIRHATIFDAADGKEIMSKFMANTNNAYVPNGIYVRLNGEKTTIEVLQAAQLCIPEIRKSDSMYFLVCKTEEDIAVLERRKKIIVRSSNVNRPRL
jgi:hypothetical protein